MSTLRQRLAVRYGIVVAVCLGLLGWLTYHEFVREPAIFREAGVAEPPGGHMGELTEVLIYAGAIMVLFLFVVTMLATEETGDVVAPDRRVWQRGIAAALGFILVGALSYLLFTGTAIDSAARTSGANGLSENIIKWGGNTQAFGMALFHGFSFPFEVTSLLIIVALLGAMILGRRSLTRDGQK